MFVWDAFPASQLYVPSVTRNETKQPLNDSYSGIGESMTHECGMKQT